MITFVHRAGQEKYESINIWALPGIWEEAEMTGIVGQLAGREIWLRCPFCGDSQNDPMKAHFSVNMVKFVYYCFRCNASGILTAKQAFQLTSQLTGEGYIDLTDTEDDQEWPTLTPGAGLSRFSAIDRYHYTDHNTHLWDAFQMRNPKDNVISGIHMRSGKHRLSFGDKGLGWAGPGCLISSPEKPIRIVEGPYDVLTYQEACVFGLISAKVLDDLAGHFIILCPDGDVWKDEKLLGVTLRTIERLVSNTKLYLLGIEYIPDGLDPDQVPPNDRLFIPRSEMFRWVSQALPSILSK